MKIEEWVKTIPGVSDEDRAAVLAAMGKDAFRGQIEEALDARSTAAARMDELKQRETQLQQQFDTRAAQYEQSLQRWQTDAEKAYQNALAAEQARAAAEATAIRADIRRLAAEYSIPEDALKSLIESRAATPPVAPPADTKTPPAPAVDTSKFMTTERFAQEAAAYAKLPAVYMRVAREHAKLFGPDTEPDVDKIIEIAGRERIPFVAAWERVHGVPAKRTELQAAAHKSEIEAAVKKATEDTEARLRSEFALENPTGSHRLAHDKPYSQVLQLPSPEARKPAESATPAGTTPAPLLRQPSQGAQSREDRILNAAKAWEKNWSEVAVNG